MDLKIEGRWTWELTRCWGIDIIFVSCTRMGIRIRGTRSTIGIVADLDLAFCGRLGLLIVAGTLELVDRLAVRIVGALTSNVNFVRFVGPGSGILVWIHYLRSVIARRGLGVRIVGRLSLRLVSRLLALSILRVGSYEVFIGLRDLQAGCRRVEMLGVLEVWRQGVYGILWTIRLQV